MTKELVRQYYTDSVRKEWRRLVADPYHQLEFDTTLYFLEKYLPDQGHVLDAGGGPGRYTIELAGRGYELTLLDFTPANLDFARRRIQRAGVKKKVRVAKPGAPIFVSVMSRLSMIIVELILFQYEIELPHFKQIRDTGDYPGGYGFTPCHFFLPEELRSDFESKPVEILDMAGLEGISSNHRKEFNQLHKNEVRRKIWLETHYLTCTHPAVVATSEHILIVCRKRTD